MSEVQWYMKQRQGKLLLQDSWQSAFYWFLVLLCYQVTLHPLKYIQKI